MRRLLGWIEGEDANVAVALLLADRPGEARTHGGLEHRLVTVKAASDRSVIVRAKPGEGQTYSLFDVMGVARKAEDAGDAGSG